MKYIELSLLDSVTLVEYVQDSFHYFLIFFSLNSDSLFGSQEVAVKKFLDQDFSGDALDEFRSEVSIQ